MNNKLITALQDCITRMDRARSILSKEGNWGMLDTEKAKTVLSEYAQTPEERRAKQRRAIYCDTKLSDIGGHRRIGNDRRIAQYNAAAQASPSVAMADSSSDDAAKPAVAAPSPRPSTGTPIWLMTRYSFDGRAERPTQCLVVAKSDYDTICTELAAANYLHSATLVEARRYAQELDAMNKKLAEFEQDAMRYRWLRKQDTVPYPSDFRPGTTDNLIVFWDGPEQLDTAIDAAREGGSGSNAIPIEETEDSAGDWQCRDYGDDWITFPTRKAAEQYQEQTGALMRYRRYYNAKK